jgi:hypothetical protein
VAGGLAHSFSRLLLKGLVKFNKLMLKSIYLHRYLSLIGVGLSAGINGGKNGIHHRWQMPKT